METEIYQTDDISRIISFLQEQEQGISLATRNKVSW